MVKVINGEQLAEMVCGAAALLDHNKETLNALNVFPVPDGDTGTNMSLTMMAAAKEVSAADKSNSVAVVDALRVGALKGARGNSGVILSQIWRGFCEGIKEAAGEVNVHVVADALQKGVECAYNAIMKPKEGTILTIAKTMAQSAAAAAEKSDDLNALMEETFLECEAVLKKTPDMLPVLKEAGVVDAGGAGLVMILKGFLMVLNGEQIDQAELLDFSADAHADAAAAEVNEDIEFGYCTEFFIKNLYDYTKERDIEEFRAGLSKIGDCVLVVGDLNLVKVHVHTNDPGIVLQTALTLGMLSQIKIDNMREQHRELEAIAPPQTKKMAMVAVVAGEGLKEVFRECQVDTFVEGGQTMNPSAEDILKAIDQAPSDQVFILPNNKNIVLAAQQAAKLSGKNAIVIPSKTVPQGITAAMNFNMEEDVAYNEQNMTDSLASVLTGQVTYAVRDTSINGKVIKEGQMIGIGEGEILANGEDVEAVSMEMLEKMMPETCATIAVYYGEDVAQEDAEALCAKLEERFDCCVVELHYGGQAIYSYIFSLE